MQAPHPTAPPVQPGTDNAPDICAWDWCRGHAVVQVDDPRQRDNPDYHDDWRYADTGEPCPGNPMTEGAERPCTFCGRLADPDGPDPCLGWLPGVQNACCGHGIDPAVHGGVEQAYVQFLGGPTWRGAAAHAYFLAQGCTPPPRPPQHPCPLY
jgi:hypothetical protein